MRSTTVREPEWDEEQQAHVMALEMYEALACGGCGGYLPETTAKDADDGYAADLPVRCHRCTAIGVQADGYRDAQQPHALRFPVHRKSTGAVP